MTTRKRVWRIVFLAATAVGIGIPVGMEIGAAVDGSDDTQTWTELIVGHVPWQAAAAVFGAVFVTLAVWLPIHFHDWYRRRAASRRGRRVTR